jgi:deazaflavin-dependent oxidoreductase (nitroreductase family)
MSYEPPDVSELQFLYLTTQGRTSGEPHMIEIWFVHHDGCFYLVSERRERFDWVQNIVRNPTVMFYVGEHAFVGTGRIVEADREPELAAAVAALMEAKYGWSDGLIVELRPDQGL